MARKAKQPEAAPKKAAATERTAQPAERSAQQAQPAGSDSSNRLLREAAWSRMFGRVESKNPFTR